MKKILVFCFAFFVLAGLAEAQETYSRMIIFGDSLNDVGNNTWVVSTGGLVPEQGAPIINSDADGKPYLWVQYLSNKLGLGAVTPSSQTTSPTVGNIDYAWAGALTLHQYSEISGKHKPLCTEPGNLSPAGECIPGLLKQLDIYFQDEQVDPNALYVILAGANDLFDDITTIINALKKNSNEVDQVQAQIHFKNLLDNLSLTPVLNISRAVSRLEKAGVPSNHILILNLPDISQTPAARDLTAGLSPAMRKTALKALSELSSLFNANLHAQVSAVSFFHGKKQIFFRLDKFFKSILAHETPIVNVLDRCDQSQAALDNHCQGYLFYNDRHPSTDAEKLLALEIEKLLAGA